MTPSRYPEILHEAADAAGVTVEEVHDAIQAVIELLPPLGKSLLKTIEENNAIYAAWLEPIARPFAESTGLKIEEVYRALVGAVQWTR